MESARTHTVSLTPAQQRAVEARGNVLVMAGAGTGKTKTLIERCLHCLEHDEATIDELLIVTFTEAAAAEMRDRLRRAIEARAQTESPEGLGNVFWTEQLARFDLAHIGTLHGFCLKLVREHFYDLGLDPRLAILDEGAAGQLARETLDDLFTAYYAGSDEFSLAVQDLVQIHGAGRDENIRKLILRLHHYSQARPDATGWLTRQRENFAAAEPAGWLQWLREAIGAWRQEWLPVLEILGRENEKAAELARLLKQLEGLETRPDWRGGTAETLGQIVASDSTWPPRRKTVLRAPLKDLFPEAEFLQSLAVVTKEADPLVEDWTWVHRQMETLLRLAENFAARLDKRKHADGVLDFHDLEQFALKLLWDFSTGQPTAVAATWRAKLKFVFVDEYQDINAAQDKIIQGLSRAEPAPGQAANRFLVGDVKQSIYRFRLADPKIFRDYARDWHGAAGTTIPLSENFRSRENLLALANSVFRLVMREEVGGVAYDLDAELKPGPAPAAVSSLKNSPCAELLVRFKNNRNDASDDEAAELAGLDNAQREARLVAWRLQQLVSERHEIFDNEKKTTRPVEWRDIAILLRSPRGRSEIFAKEFERAGIPLAVARGGFFESAEILDLLSLLQLLDNPLQDVPCIAVLRSPLVGLSLDELAHIRRSAGGGRFWTALMRHQMSRSENPGGPGEKLAAFLEKFGRWRKLAKLASLSQCLDEVLRETLYADWLRAQPRGAQRAANVSAFLQLAHQFDQFQRQGLFRFLKFIEAQQEAEAVPDVPAFAVENAVRLMSIHQSKGLEFPVVVLADLSKQFNERDLRGEIIFDEEFGLCPKIKPPELGRRYPSLPHWLAQRRQKRELRGEELRLFYVALTRARDHLILTSSISDKHWEEKWNQPQPVTVQKIAGAKSFSDWLALWFSNQTPVAGVQGGARGEVENLRWQVVVDEEVTAPAPATPQNSPAAKAPDNDTGGVGPDSAKELRELRARLEWNYPNAAATLRKAKSSVTTLRREAEELDDEAEQIFPEREQRVRLHVEAGAGKLSAPEIGAAHHKFLQYVDLNQLAELPGEAARLLREKYLSPDERAVLDLAALAAFWKSSLGRKIQSHLENVRRELPFTARFSPQELEKITGIKGDPALAGEFVIVQGVADLVVLQPEEIWLVDFKTDEITPAELEDKIRHYAPQLHLYAAALQKIFARQVTKRALHFLATGHTREI